MKTKTKKIKFKQTAYKDASPEEYRKYRIKAYDYLNCSIKDLKTNKKVL